MILSAKALKPALLVSARVASEQSEKKMRLAGADYVFAPYDMTGNRMAQVMLKPHVFQFIDFTTKSMGLDVGIEQFACRRRANSLRSRWRKRRFARSWA